MKPNFLFQPQRPISMAPRAFPPLNFQEARDPHDVRLINYTHQPSRVSASRRAGIRYESRWHTFAGKTWKTEYKSFPDKLFAFSDVSGQRCCRPDGILISAKSDFFVIFEVKVGHISDSYWQLRRLYEPVLSQWSYCRGRRSVVVEVCRRFDPATFYPGRVKVLNIFDADEYFNVPQDPEEVGVLIWKDR